jgi:hypothetical protein
MLKVQILIRGLPCRQLPKEINDVENAPRSNNNYFIESEVTVPAIVISQFSVRLLITFTSCSVYI